MVSSTKKQPSKLTNNNSCPQNCYRIFHSIFSYVSTDGSWFYHAVGARLHRIRHQHFTDKSTRKLSLFAVSKYLFSLLKSFITICMPHETLINITIQVCFYAVFVWFFVSKLAQPNLPSSQGPHHSFVLPINPPPSHLFLPFPPPFLSPVQSFFLFSWLIC